MKPIRVLVVDDSAFARKVLRESLATSAAIEVVATASDGIDALEKIDQLKPDVITLDLVMPNLDGLGVLKALDPAQRRRVVIVSMAGGDSELAIAALAAGAFELVHKPTALAIDLLRDVAAELVAKVVAAGQSARHVELGTVQPLPARSEGRRSDRVVLIGTSTGGPQALTRLITALPADFPAPIAIVLHIPPGYTQALAERLDSESAIDVVEASQGLELRPGLAVVGLAGMHLYIVSHGGRDRVHLDLEPRASVHRPSVDVLFESAARSLGSRALGVVLTGMGDDGLKGARALVAAGGQVLTEAEGSCVVYGMPRVVREAGLSSGEALLGAMAAEISSRL
ncbi:MAG TPA: chemotaxis-specific protein-glutamate methyltransferase CheB [Polyangiaceae bacterium]